MKKLSALSKSDPELAQLLADQVSATGENLVIQFLVCNSCQSCFLFSIPQLFANAMITAGLEEDPRTIITNLNQLLTKALEKI